MDNIHEKQFDSKILLVCRESGLLVPFLKVFVVPFSVSRRPHRMRPVYCVLCCNMLGTYVDDCGILKLQCIVTRGILKLYIILCRGILNSAVDYVLEF